jgi:hypothetical protein
VYAAIDVYAIGLLDADARGINGTLSARIFDRSTDRVVVGPVTVARGQARADDTNPFVFKTVPTVRLQPGVYSIVSVGFTSDRFMSNSQQVRLGDCRLWQRRCVLHSVGERWERVAGVDREQH